MNGPPMPMKRPTNSRSSRDACRIRRATPSRAHWMCRASSTTWIRIIRRTILLFLLGLIVNGLFRLDWLVFEPTFHIDVGKIRIAGVLQRIDQSRHGLIGDRQINQERLGRVADARATGLGIQQDSLGHVQVGGVMNVDVAVADPGLDGRHLRVADHRVDQAGSPARYHDVDQAAGLNQMGDR